MKKNLTKVRSEFDKYLSKKSVLKTTGRVIHLRIYKNHESIQQLAIINTDIKGNND